MLKRFLVQTVLTLSLVCQEARSSLLDLWVREGLVRYTPLYLSPGKCGLDRLLESERRGSAKQSAEQIEELHLELDLVEATARRPALQMLIQTAVFEHFRKVTACLHPDPAALP